MQQQELKSCPFCGSACQLDQRKTNEWAIACRDVDCPWDIVAWFTTKSEAVTAWNTRHPSLDEPAVVEFSQKDIANIKATVGAMRLQHERNGIWEPWWLRFVEWSSAMLTTPNGEGV